MLNLSRTLASPELTAFNRSAYEGLHVSLLHKSNASATASQATTPKPKLRPQLDPQHPQNTSFSNTLSYPNPAIPNYI
jgi:hypothetical protein